MTLEQFLSANTFYPDTLLIVIAVPLLFLDFMHKNNVTIPGGLVHVEHTLRVMKILHCQNYFC